MYRRTFFKTRATFRGKKLYVHNMEEKKTRLKVEVEYIDCPDEAERLTKTAKLLSAGVYAYLKKEGLLKIDPQRQEKVREAMDKAREIINRNIEE